MSAPSSINPEFDHFAENYDEAIQRGLAVSGEKKEFFAAGRVAWLARRLGEAGLVPRRILDYGCGTGTSAPLLLGLAGAEQVLGVEISPKSVEVARRLHGSDRARFAVLQEYEPDGTCDLAFCNGVFHHIPLAARAGAVDYVFRSLRPGGWFALWENNPWNPGTRYIMSRIPFDRDAITLSPPGGRRMLEAGGFAVVRTDFLFFFPRSLGWLRRLEPRLRSVPLGAQYLVLGRKP